MGIKIKQSPKPVNDQKKRVLKQKEGGKKSVVPKQVKNASVETNKTTESTMESKKQVPKCELNKEQVQRHHYLLTLFFIFMKMNLVLGYKSC